MENTRENKLAELREKNAELESLEEKDKEITNELNEFENEKVH